MKKITIILLVIINVLNLRSQSPLQIHAPSQFNSTYSFLKVNTPYITFNDVIQGVLDEENELREFTAENSPVKLSVYNNPSILPCHDMHLLNGNLISSIKLGSTNYELGKQSSSFYFDLEYELVFKALNTYNSSVEETFVQTLILKSDPSEFIVEQNNVFSSPTLTIGNNSNSNVFNKVFLHKITLKSISMGSPSVLSDINFDFSLDVIHKSKPDYTQEEYATKWVGDGAGGIIDNPKIVNTNLEALKDVFVWSKIPYVLGENAQNDNCITYPTSFQIEILRLYNINPENKSDIKLCNTIVDWKKATRLDIPVDFDNLNGYYRFNNFIPNEGTGFYIYRVRPIFNFYPGGANNELNWGNWNRVYICNPNANNECVFERKTNMEYKTGDIIYLSLSETYVNAAGIYIEVPEDKNWSHQRNYSLDTANIDQFHDNIVYFDDLLNPRQSLNRLSNYYDKLKQGSPFINNDDGYVIGAQTIYDNMGRAVINTLPLPIQSNDNLDGLTLNSSINSSLKYRKHLALEDNNLIKSSVIPSGTSTQPVHPFDIELNGGRLNDYYDGNSSYGSFNNPSLGSNYLIPNAETKGFLHSVLSDDGLNRIELQSMAGDKHKITNPDLGQTSHALEYFYTKATERELVSLFGQEAPNPNNISKEYVLDKTSDKISVSYKSFDGKLLATAINLSNPTDHMIDYGTLLSGDFTYSFKDQTISNNTFLLDGKVSFPVGKTIDVTYNANVTNLHLNLCSNLKDKIKTNLGVRAVNAQNSDDLYIIPEFLNYTPKNTYSRVNNFARSFPLTFSGVYAPIYTVNTHTSFSRSEIGLNLTSQGDYNFFNKIEIADKTSFNGIKTAVSEYFYDNFYKIQTTTSPGSIYRFDRVLDYIRTYRQSLLSGTKSNINEFITFMTATSNQNNTFTKLNTTSGGEIWSEEVVGQGETTKKYLKATLDGCVDNIQIEIPECKFCDYAKFGDKIQHPDSNTVQIYDVSGYILKKFIDKYGGKTIYGWGRIDDIYEPLRDFYANYNDKKSIQLPDNNTLLVDHKYFDILFYSYGLPLELYRSTEFSHGEKYTNYKLDYSIYDGFNILIRNIMNKVNESNPYYTENKICLIIDQFTDALLTTAVTNFPNEFNTTDQLENSNKLYFNKNINTLDLLFNDIGRGLIGSADENQPERYIEKAYHYFKKYSVKSEKIFTRKEVSVIDPIPASPYVDEFRTFTPYDYYDATYEGTVECEDNSWRNKKNWESYYKNYSSAFITEDKKSHIDKNKSAKTDDKNKLLEQTKKDIEIVKNANGQDLSKEIGLDGTKSLIGDVLGNLNICEAKRPYFDNILRTYLQKKFYYIEGSVPLGVTTNNIIPKADLKKLVDMMEQDCHLYTDTDVKVNPAYNPAADNNEIGIDDEATIPVYTTGVDEDKRKKYLRALVTGKPLVINGIDIPVQNSNLGLSLNETNSTSINCKYETNFSGSIKTLSQYQKEIDVVANNIQNAIRELQQGMGNNIGLFSIEDRNVIRDIVIHNLTPYWGTNNPVLWDFKEGCVSLIDEYQSSVFDYDKDNVFNCNISEKHHVKKSYHPWNYYDKSSNYKSWLPNLLLNEHFRSYFELGQHIRTISETMFLYVNSLFIQLNNKTFTDFDFEGDNSNEKYTLNYNINVKTSPVMEVLFHEIQLKNMLEMKNTGNRKKHIFSGLRKKVIPITYILEFKIKNSQGKFWDYNTGEFKSENDALTGFAMDIAWIGIKNQEFNNCVFALNSSAIKEEHKLNVNTCAIRYEFEKPIQPNTTPVDLDSRICGLDFLDKLENEIINKVANKERQIQNEVASEIDSYYENLSKNVTQKLDITYHDDLTYFTLYYYDRAGNLTRTVPPKGVQFASSRNVFPAHTHYTEYEYDRRGLLIKSKSPDETAPNRFWYNRAGQLRYSQSAKQTAENKISYNLYDVYGRNVESSELFLGNDCDESKMGRLFFNDILNINLLENNNFPKLPTDFLYLKANCTTDVVNSHRIITNYSNMTEIPGYPGFKSTQPVRQNLRNRVNFVTRDEDGDLLTKADQVKTYYSYDLHGNVEYVVQDLPVSTDGAFRLFGHTQYKYDLLTKKVTGVAYNYYESDSYVQDYNYSSDDKLSNVISSRYGRFGDREAQYQYYAHSPLKRIELGEDRLQGVDYTYTINGWLKSINHTDLNISNMDVKDPGKDGLNVAPPPNQPMNFNINVGKDAFSMTLNYFENDFVSSVNSNYANSSLFSGASNPFPELFDGNIAIWQTNSMFYNGSNFSYDNFDQGFKYDKINRLKHSNSYVGSPAVGDNYKTSYNYDPNGNITNLSRFNGTGAAFDNLSYNYTNGSNDNKLTQITDAVTPSPSSYVGDLETQSNANNYEYDASGNLTKDVSENISNIEWTPDGKIKKIIKAPVEIEYLYDAMGQRVTKNVTTTTMVIPEPPLPPDPTPVKNRKQTIYARDANGQVMAIYEREFNPNEPNNPGPRLKFRLIMEWITHGCFFELEIEEGVDFEYVEYPPGVLHPFEIETKADKYYTFDCVGQPYSFMLPGGSKIYPSFGGPKEYESKYRHPNLNNLNIENIPKFLTVFVEGVQNSFKINSISSKISYLNPTLLPKLAEWHVYGNEQQGRFLTKYPEIEPTYYGVGISDDIRNGIFSRQLGKKAYELKDHLGNVRVTFSDVKMPTIQTAPPYNRTAPYSVDLLSKAEYFPGGMPITELTYQLENKRYGYNSGSEVDREIFAQKDRAFSTLFREGDTYTLRWWSQDPKRNELPHQSTYSYMDANPILKNDPLGDDPDFKFNSQQRVRDAKNLGTSVKALRDKEINGAYTPLTSFVLGFTPIIGDGIDVYDFGNELSQGNYLQAGLSGASLIPMADIVTKPIKAILKHSDEALEAVGDLGKKVDDVKLIGPAGDASAEVTIQIPNDWIRKTSDNGQGTKFLDPKNPKGNNVRVQGGNPNSPNPGQQKPYVKQNQNGKTVDVNGKPVKSDSKEAHIPKEDFKFKKE